MVLDYMATEWWCVVYNGVLMGLSYMGTHMVFAYIIWLQIGYMRTEGCLVIWV